MLSLLLDQSNLVSINAAAKEMDNTNKPVSSLRYILCCAYTKDLNQCAHARGLIRVLNFRLKIRRSPGYPKSAIKGSDQPALMRRMI